MIDRSEARDLIEQLAGDEHDWVDLKEDYYIDGPDVKKADFVKDVVAMTNTITNQNTHYIFIGVEDGSGDLVGVSDNFDESSGARHILAEDESNIQDILIEYLAPKPDMDLYKFVDSDPKFGVLSITPENKKPCVIQKSITVDGNVKLKKGIIYFRNGSSNAIATRSHIEKFIDERVDNRRENILKGIRKAAEIGPEAVANVGEVVYDEEGDVTVEIGEEGDFVMEEQFSREPVSDNINDRLTMAIKEWMTEGSIPIDSESLWEYYNSTTNITIDDQSIRFLTKASLENKVLGGFWLSYTDMDTTRSILHSEHNGHHRNVKISELLFLMGDCDGLKTYYDENNINRSLDEFETLIEHCGDTSEERLDYLLSDSKYEIGYSEWTKSFDPTTMTKKELRELIRELSQHLIRIEQKVSGLGKWYKKKQRFIEGFNDSERALVARSF